MTTTRQATSNTEGNGATTGYEAELWQMADALRGSMDAAEYKHVVLGLIFLKYISDAFRGSIHPAGGGAERRGRSRRPRRVPRREHFLGACRGPLVASQGAGAAAHHRPSRGRGYGRY